MATKKAEETEEKNLEEVVEEAEEMTLDKALEMIEKLEQKNAELEQKYRKLNKQGEGYLIKTPNPMYDDTFKGLRFINGLAFVMIEGEYPAFRPEPMKESQVENMSAEDQEAYRERMAKPDWYWVLQEIKSDYPKYEVVYYNEKELSDLDDVELARGKERVAAEEDFKAALNAQQIITRQAMGMSYGQG